MTDDQNECPEFEVPVAAYRATQIIVFSMTVVVIFAPTLVAYLTAGKPLRPVRIPIETIMAIGFTMLIVVVKIVSQRSMSKSSAWRGIPAETRQLSRFQRATHYVSNSVLSACLYLWPAEICLFAYYRERFFIGAFVGCALILLTFMEFPTSDRAKAWAERYFRRPDSLPPV